MEGLWAEICSEAEHVLAPPRAWRCGESLLCTEQIETPVSYAQQVLSADMSFASITTSDDGMHNQARLGLHNTSLLTTATAPSGDMVATTPTTTSVAEPATVPPQKRREPRSTKLLGTKGTPLGKRRQQKVPRVAVGAHSGSACGTSSASVAEEYHGQQQHNVEGECSTPPAPRDDYTQRTEQSLVLSPSTSATLRRDTDEGQQRLKDWSVYNSLPTETSLHCDETLAPL